MRLLPISLALLALLAVAGCSRPPKDYEINMKLHDTWGACPGVTVGKVEIVSTQGNKARFKYVLHMNVDGAKIGLGGCPVDNRTMLEALANKDLAELKAGDDIPAEAEATH